MADGTQEKAYLTEHFTTGCILHGKIRYLEEIKRQIIDKYVEKSDQMAKISQVQKTKDYCRIAGQLSDYPFIQVNSLRFYRHPGTN